MGRSRTVWSLVILIFWCCGLSFSPHTPLISASASLTERKVDDQSLRKVLDPQSISFEPKSALDGVTAEGFEFSSETWDSSDGARIFLTRQYCRSSKNAEKALRQLTSKATLGFLRGEFHWVKIERQEYPYKRSTTFLAF
jgi:hypothetical protein